MKIHYLYFHRIFLIMATFSYVFSFSKSLYLLYILWFELKKKRCFLVLANLPMNFLATHYISFVMLSQHKNYTLAETLFANILHTECIYTFYYTKCLIYGTQYVYILSIKLNTENRKITRTQNDITILLYMWCRIVKWDNIMPSETKLILGKF